MMKLETIVFTVLAGMLLLPTSARADAVDVLLGEYHRQGAGPFSATAGKTLWQRTYSAKSTPSTRRCTSCHGGNPKVAGKHVRTGKVIAPMASSANPRRLTNIRKINKWFRRNCKWVLGRTCTTQEKGDVLMYLRHL